MNKLSPSQAEQLQEIGTYLKQKRLDQSLSLEAIAASTMIRLPILHALEEGDGEELPELIYIKGFIRRYGQVLGIDGQALAAKLIAEETPPISESLIVSATPEATPDHAPPQAQRSGFLPINASPRWLPFLLGGLAIAAGLFYWLTRSPQTQKPAVTKTAPPVAVSPTPVPSAPVEPSPTPAAREPSPNLPLSVKVKAKQDSWLKVTIDGQVDYEGTLKSGEEKTWTAQKSLKLRSGNAGAIKLSLNDQPQKPLGEIGQIKEVTFTPTGQPNP